MVSCWLVVVVLVGQLYLLVVVVLVGCSIVGWLQYLLVGCSRWLGVLVGSEPEKHPMFKEERYIRQKVFPQQALQLADEKNAFTIVDWATWLSFRASTKNTQVYVVGGKLLLNPCHAIVVEKNATAKPHIMKFLNYLASERAQNVLKHFGEEKYGEPLFTPAAQMDFDAWTA